MKTKTVVIETLPGCIPPRRATEGAAGMDLFAREGGGLDAGDRVLVGAGFKIALPVGTEAQIRTRSGLALKRGVHVLNAPGTIDPDYRGEVGVILHNSGALPFFWNKGDRIAQMVIAEYVRADFHEVPEGSIGRTDRGDGGFGSTGV